MADKEIYDKHVDQKIIEAHDEAARVRLNPYNELKVGDVVKVKVYLNGVEVEIPDGNFYVQEKEEALGKMRVYEVILNTEIVSKPPKEQLEP